MAKEIMTEEFNSFINQDKPVLVDFWAPWCGPCRMVGPVVEEISQDYEGTVAVGKVDVDKNPDLAKQFRVMSIPTLIVLKDGKVANQATGARPKAGILALL